MDQVGGDVLGKEISQNKALLMRRLMNLKFQRETTVAEHTSEFQNLVNQLTSVDLQFNDEMQALLLLSSLPESWKTLVVSFSNSAPNGKLTTSMVMDALFNEEARRREMGSIDQSESQALVSEGSRERGRGQGRGHHRGTEKGRWRSQARGRTVRVVGRGSVQFRMADRRSVTLTEVRHVPNLRKNLISIGMLDSKGCNFDASGGILRVSKGNKEMLWGRKTRGLYRLEGSVQTGGATVRHGSSGISKENGQGKQPLHRGTQSKRRGTWGIRSGTWRIRSGTRAQGDALGYLCAQGRRDGATTTRKVTYFAAHPDGGWGHPSGGGGTGHFGVESYGGARSETVRKDNLKTSDYPPVGWRGRLLSPAHLDESKPTWMSTGLVAKSKPDWSSYGVSM
ncbi:hypothetical protein Acr_00g0052030 [Actinidia rufa]|uniref:Retrovirus-related Pol polyprotein from transposon TNT 1-94-like beta-barrel domain-containing protein n=1 Tax=Actinidia rufa TaxID=165716 RepID=A0A7J0DMW0_9ERIC|nr:hypothetical protein Acr_00g0052030 [Actinidia rufa]